MFKSEGCMLGRRELLELFFIKESGILLTCVLENGLVNVSRLGGDDNGERGATLSGLKKLDDVFPRLPGPQVRNCHREKSRT